MINGPSTYEPNIQELDGHEPLIVREEQRNDVEIEGGQHGCWFLCCHPSSKIHRFVALIFMCLLGFGSFFCYDNPAALESHIEKDLNITTTQYVMLYSIYSWPNVILCFVGGFLIDSIGGESLSIAQNNYAVLWFKGKELNMVFGLQLSFSRIGSSVNFLVVEELYNWVNQTHKDQTCLGIVLYIAALTCVFSFCCAIILNILDRRAERILQRTATSSNEVVRLSDVFVMPCTFWLVILICVSYYVAIFPFIGLAEGFFMKKFNMTNKQANTINSMLYLISAFASPIIGFLIDKTGKNIIWIIVSIACTTLGHCLFAFTFLNPYVGIVIIGLAYSCLAASLWPLVAIIIPEYQLGTAYGVCQAVQNLGLAVIGIVAGLIVDHFGYIWMEVFFISCLIIAFITAIGLWYADSHSDGVLNMSQYNRLLNQQRKLAAEIYDKERLLSSEEVPESTSNTTIQEPSDVQIRNRYLSRIGAPFPEHLIN